MKRTHTRCNKKRPLDARALGDLSHFPALCRLYFSFCKVMLSPSILGAMRHASLTTLCFCIAHPARDCAPVVLQLSQALWGLGRGSVVRCVVEGWPRDMSEALEKAQGRAPCQVFKTALEACGP